MTRTPALVEIHYALWAVLALPFGFAGLFFFFPGLNFVTGAILMGIAGFLLLYVTRLTRGERWAWLVGVLGHTAGVIAALYYVPRWEPWLAYPFLAASLYSVIVLAVNRGLWLRGRAREAQAAW